METTRFRLHPGEEVRTPRILLQQWPGGSFDVGHNAFRQLMLEEYIPKNNGVTILPPVAYNSAASLCMARTDATIENQQAMARKAAELGCEDYWLDAYWFPTPWAERAGDWYPRPEDFPHGLRPLADTVHELGMKFILWFEPERVMADTDWGRRYSEHVLRIPDAPQGLLNLGAPEVQEMVTEFLDRCVKEWDVDIYRQDFNMEPLPYWHAADEPDRQGITEMKYIAGFYRIWDGLLDRNPGLMIDNCASGGRRIDIETCSRALPLWRSDCNEVHRGEQGRGFYAEMALADQVQVSGLSLYVPYHAGPVWSTEPYCWRSAMAAGASMYGYLDGFDPLLSRAAIAELQELRPLWRGSLHVLTPLTLDDGVWHAFQLHRSDLGKGCLFAFRRAACTEDALRVNLREIDPAATYRVEVRDNAYGPGVFHQLPGAALAHYVVRTDHCPGAVLIIYERT